MKPAICPRCQGRLPATARFCPRCGRRCSRRMAIGVWMVGGLLAITVVLTVTVPGHKVNVATRLSPAAPKSVPHVPAPPKPPRTPIDLLPNVPDATSKNHQPPSAPPAGFVLYRPNSDPLIMPVVDPANPTKKVPNVVFDCDASGSMMGLRFDLLKIALKKSIDALSPEQGFNVIFFQRSNPTAFSQVPVIASPANKQKAYDFIENAELASGSNPMPGLRLALSTRPQLVYLVTDGDFEGASSDVTNNMVFAELRQLNQGRQTRINTIGLFSPDQRESEKTPCENVLRQIAEENGGKFTVLETTALLNQR